MRFRLDPVLAARRSPVLATLAIALLTLGWVPAARATDDLVKVDSTLWMANNSVTAITRSGNTIYLGGNFTQVFAWTGTAASLSTTSGQPVSPFPRTDGTVYAVAPDGSGGWYLGGAFTRLGRVARQNLAHVLANGTVDAWAPGANAVVYSLAVSHDTVYVGGGFSMCGHQSRSCLAAVDGNGNALPTWNPAPNSNVFCMQLKNGVLYLGGQFGTMGAGSPVARVGLSAVDAVTGTLQPWNPTTNNIVRAMAIQGSTMYVGGYFTTLGGNTRLRIGAVDLTTGVASSWNPRSTGVVFALAATASKVYVGMQPDSIGGQIRRGIATIDATTGLADPWNPDPQGYVYSLVLNGSTLYAGGTFNLISGQTRNQIAEIDLATGNPTAWDPNANSDVYAMAKAGTRLAIGGIFTELGNRTRNRIAAIDATTGALTGWDPNLNGAVYSIAVRNGIVYAGGAFSTISASPAVTRNGLVAIDSVTAVPTIWNPGVTVGRRVDAILLGPSSLYAAGNFLGIGGKPTTYLGEVDLVNGFATTWNPKANNEVETIILDGTTLYAGGYFSSVGDSTRHLIGAVSTVTGTASAWNPNASGASGVVLAMALDGAHLYAGGTFTAIGDSARKNLAALDVVAGKATAWKPEANGTVRTLLVNDAMVYAGGDFTTIGNQTRHYLASLDPSGLADPTWDPNLSNVVYELAWTGNTMYVGGAFTTVHGLADPEYYLASLRFVPGTTGVPFGAPRVTPGLTLTGWPNPARESTRLRFALPTPGPVRLTVFDPAGRRVAAVLDASWMTAGPHEATLATARLGTGCYFARLEAGGRIGMWKVLVVR